MVKQTNKPIESMKIPYTLLEKLCIFVLIITWIGIISISVYDSKTLNVDTTQKKQYRK